MKFSRGILDDRVLEIASNPIAICCDELHVLVGRGAQFSPEQNGMVERMIRTLKEQCVHRYRFEPLQNAVRVIGDWIQFYNLKRPHQALGMKTPAEAFALAA